MKKNSNLHAAKSAKNDEFYTQLSDIEQELRHYRESFRGKTILCNCDDPRVSNFFHYFFMNFKFFGLKKLIATCYKNQEWNLFSEGECEKAVYMVYDGPTDPNDDGHMPKDEDIVVRHLEGDGDFRSAECRAFLEAADIVVTNPPFSLFIEFVTLMNDYKKKFLIIGNKNAITYKEIFPLFKDNKIWLGIKPMSQDFYFNITDEYAKEIISTKKEGSGYRIINGKVMARAAGIWFTNLVPDNAHSKEPVILVKKYNPKEYPKYDNYDAINVDKVADIPIDYFGVIGVPITFLDKWNPNASPEPEGVVTTNDFDIVEFRKGNDGKDLVYSKLGGGQVQPYFRILIQRQAFRE